MALVGFVGSRVHENRYYTTGINTAAVVQNQTPTPQTLNPKP